MCYAPRVKSRPADSRTVGDRRRLQTTRVFPVAALERGKVDPAGACGDAPFRLNSTNRQGNCQKKTGECRKYPRIAGLRRAGSATRLIRPPRVGRPPAVSRRPSGTAIAQAGAANERSSDAPTSFWTCRTSAHGGAGDIATRTSDVSPVSWHVELWHESAVD